MNPRRSFIGPQQQIPQTGVGNGQVPAGLMQQAFPSQGVIPAGLFQTGVPQALFPMSTNQPTPYFQQLMQEYQQMQQQMMQRGQPQQGQPQAPVYSPSALGMAFANLQRVQAQGTGGANLAHSISGMPNVANGDMNNTLPTSGRNVYAQTPFIQSTFPRVGGNTAPTPNTVPSYRNVNVSSGQGVGQDYRNSLQTQVNRLGDMSAGIGTGIARY